MDIGNTMQFLKTGGVIPYSEWASLVRHPDLTYENLISLQSDLERPLSELKLASVEKNTLQDLLIRRVQSGEYTIEVEEPDTGIDYGDGEETDQEEEDDED